MLKEEIILQRTPEMKMGMKIKEVQITERLGCSPTPVREAINMLRQDNLIVGNSFHTSEIISFSQKDVYDLLTLRAELEVSALRQAMPNFTPEDIVALKNLLQDYAKANEGTDFTKISALNGEFHNYILMKTGNRALSKVLGGIKDQAALLRAPVVEARKSQRESGVEAEAVSEHAAIIAAIEKGDCESACESMKKHMLRVRKDVCDYYAQHQLDT